MVIVERHITVNYLLDFITGYRSLFYIFCSILRVILASAILSYIPHICTLMLYYIEQNLLRLNDQSKFTYMD